jgi:hypothetical protein
LTSSKATSAAVDQAIDAAVRAQKARRIPVATSAARGMRAAGHTKKTAPSSSIHQIAIATA